MMINYLHFFYFFKYKNDSVKELEEDDKIKKERRSRSGRAFRRYYGKMKIIFLSHCQPNTIDSQLFL